MRRNARPLCNLWRKSDLAKNRFLEIAEMTVEQRNGYGFTYSDIVQRLLPTIVLDAYPDSSVRFDRALNLATAMKPTPPFQENLKG